MDDDAPRSFQLCEGGPRYMVAVEVARYFHQSPEQLFELYPSLYRRQATTAERGTLKRWNISHAPIVTLLLAEEVECILEKDDRRLHLQPLPAVAKKPSTFKDEKVLLTRSSHAPPIPKQPTQPLKPARPRNLFAPYYASPCGLASTSDEEPEHLASITLNLDLNGHKLRDQFLWNTQDKSISVYKFAQQLCQDLEVPTLFTHQVAAAIQSQIDAHHALKEYTPETDNIIIKLEVQVGTTQLVDQFEWDISNPLNSPEHFAETLTRDLGLGPTYTNSIAVAIREKVLQAKQALLQSQVPELAPPVADAEEVFRVADADEWGPALYTMSRRELHKKQTDEDRESRRRRRGRPEDRQSKRSKRAQEQAKSDDAAFEVESLQALPSYTPRVKAYLVQRGFGDIEKKEWIKAALARQPPSKKAFSNA
ncbi:hypothetical protein PTSG_08750 [Salpingoeca rosetta]|uniref:SWI/SNF Subunit INI1 DNA binding domain-containing protein n=1 Tax=Salpingoeca rosetta (strain ATCC 50818 / BSB-021) TaxID=946362 RepID=F2UKK9_SALR5|nr:uncharacterized protein PTSG_08750 [Salpingoeca rosetta]EGD77658.1 hypothetical protein PTSG_08750 [Salpingoeca rosetta]|eukprot:XP_004990134.1 hypothetical protein PTSG_08750 [Salpingoeca rosetta]